MVCCLHKWAYATDYYEEESKEFVFFFYCECCLEIKEVRKNGTL